jgi:hypothetical protein
VGIGLRDPSLKRETPRLAGTGWGTLRFHPSMLQRVQALSFLSRLALSESAARDDKGEGNGSIKSSC